MTQEIEKAAGGSMRSIGANYLRDHLLDPSQAEVIAERAFCLMFNAMLKKTEAHGRQ